MGVEHCDSLLMLLAASTQMEEREREIVTRKLIEGFSDQAKLAGTVVSGGQTVRNPWPIIGGVAMSMCRKENFILPTSAQVGDFIILTKPLGTQVVVNVHQWLHIPDRWKKVEGLISKEEAVQVFQQAGKSMARLNKVGAMLMHKYKAHAATDVTGFGIIGHANNLASSQEADVYFELHTLPIWRKMRLVDESLNNNFRLMQGRAAETSGGLLVCLSPANAVSFCEEIFRLEGKPAWIIGTVKQGEGDRNKGLSGERAKGN
eukprot:TRINITY_DN8294_c0_g1_i1.p1 TRINITY_DN8294_c0_g1~~TRINITY_DN8294_c0_g1_i1.p1  ORF type:complete len:261 (+),score=34.77 TRINITY_DN8294_c0_g1_i1:323-1105(+)